MMDDLRHGGSLDRMRAAFPDAPEPWIDLSTGINPWPYPVQPVRPDTLQALPTHAAQVRCRDAMAASIGAPAEALQLAPGSELLIRLLPRIISPRRVAVLQPSYGDHAQVWRAAGCDVIETDAPLASAESVDAVVLCNPNNPDGRVFDPEELEMARATLAARGGWLIVDEAYASLSPDISMAGRGGADGLIILRSFGKFFGLAGVRLGALIAPDDILRAMSDLLGAWPVSGPALDLGALGYADAAWQAGTRQRLNAGRQTLDRILLSGGFSNILGTNLFRFAECDDAHGRWRRLAEAGIYVRRFAWSDRHLRFGLPGTRAAEIRLKSALSP